MTNFGGSPKRPGLSPAPTKAESKRAVRPQKQKRPDQGRGVNFHNKSVLQQYSIVKENMQRKQDCRKPLDCWEIAEVTLDFSLSKEKV
jgi:hypothetical protein